MAVLKLRDIAHARAGDKGNRSNVCVFVYDARDYPVLLREITAKRLKTAYPDLLKGEIRRYELPNLDGINLVMDQALEGGVNESLNLDGHGKSWSYLILDLEIG